MSFPARIEDNPAFLNWGSERGRVLYGEDVYVDYRFYDKVHRPALFPFGHGLSYTTFKLSNLKIIVNDSTVDATVTVANTGSRQGAEVVQAYVGASAPSIKRPLKELKGFKKVFLEPGQERVVNIEMDKRLATSFWDEVRDSWIVERGRYKVLVGNSSRCEAFLEETFVIEETFWWTGL